MSDEHRCKILDAAARVYAQVGWRGATTKRIAEAAGVNEVTLFRHFGSKDTLLHQMIQELSLLGDDIVLPMQVVDPESELLTWATAHYARITKMRAIARQVISDAEWRPEVAACATHGPSAATAQLRQYAIVLRRGGRLRAADELTPGELNAACGMLMGALFADGMNRDMMPGMFSQPADESLRGYVRMFLRAIGAQVAPWLSGQAAWSAPDPSPALLPVDGSP